MHKSVWFSLFMILFSAACSSQPDSSTNQSSQGSAAHLSCFQKCAMGVPIPAENGICTDTNGAWVRQVTLTLPDKASALTCFNPAGDWIVPTTLVDGTQGVRIIMNHENIRGIEQVGASTLADLQKLIFQAAMAGATQTAKLTTRLCNQPTARKVAETLATLVAAYSGASTDKTLGNAVAQIGGATMVQAACDLAASSQASGQGAKETGEFISQDMQLVLAAAMKSFADLPAGQAYAIDKDDLTLTFAIPAAWIDLYNKADEEPVVPVLIEQAPAIDPSAYSRNGLVPCGQH